MSYFRKNIDLMNGYTPGEQPKIPGLVKLNTNESPYPPSPEIQNLLKNIDYSMLRLYPNPMSDALRDCIAQKYGFRRENILAGNGSDDLLTIAIRSFVGDGEKIACFDPTYSLYEVLAKIQNASPVKINLTPEFDVPESFLKTGLKEISDSPPVKLFFLARPNAPTGRSIGMESVVKICEQFKGIVLIDEAYADFAQDHCLALVNRFSNVIVCRTLSKSYSLAGVRIGFAVSNASLIEGMNKVKDSYNTSFLSQQIAIAALNDDKHFKKCIDKIVKSREYLSKALREIGFEVIPSQANFVFAAPPKDKAADLFDYLRENNILVRYFPSHSTKRFIRITIGRHEDMELLVNLCSKFVSVR